MDAFYHDLPYMFDKERIRKMSIQHRHRSSRSWVEQDLNARASASAPTARASCI